MKKYLKDLFDENMWVASEPKRSSIMQQSAKNSQTMYPVFNNSYLIQIMLKSSVLSNYGKLYKSSTWEKYNFLQLKFLLG